MRLLLGSLFALLIAAAVGLGTTWLVLTRGTAFGAVPIGAWVAWPKTGTRDIDPYSRATFARTGELPVGSGDGVAFFARTDDNGRALDGRCDVRIVERQRPEPRLRRGAVDPHVTAAVERAAVVVGAGEERDAVA